MNEIIHDSFSFSFEKDTFVQRTEAIEQQVSSADQCGFSLSVIYVRDGMKVPFVPDWFEEGKAVSYCSNLLHIELANIETGFRPTKWNSSGNNWYTIVWSAYLSGGNVVYAQNMALQPVYYSDTMLLKLKTLYDEAKEDDLLIVDVHTTLGTTPILNDSGAHTFLINRFDASLISWRTTADNMDGVDDYTLNNNTSSSAYIAADEMGKVIGTYMSYYSASQAEGCVKVYYAQVVRSIYLPFNSAFKLDSFNNLSVMVKTVNMTNTVLNVRYDGTPKDSQTNQALPGNYTMYGMPACIPHASARVSFSYKLVDVTSTEGNEKIFSKA